MVHRCKGHKNGPHMMQAYEFNKNILIESWVTVYSRDTGYTFHSQAYAGEFLRCRGPKKMEVYNVIA